MRINRSILGLAVCAILIVLFIIHEGVTQEYLEPGLDYTQSKAEVTIPGIGTVEMYGPSALRRGDLDTTADGRAVVVIDSMECMCLHGTGPSGKMRIVAGEKFGLRRSHGKIVQENPGGNFFPAASTLDVNTRFDAEGQPGSGSFCGDSASIMIAEIDEIPPPSIYFPYREIMLIDCCTGDTIPFKQRIPCGDQHQLLTDTPPSVPQVEEQVNRIRIRHTANEDGEVSLSIVREQDCFDKIIESGPVVIDSGQEEETTVDELIEALKDAIPKQCDIKVVRPSPNELQITSTLLLEVGACLKGPGLPPEGVNLGGPVSALGQEYNNSKSVNLVTDKRCFPDGVILIGLSSFTASEYNGYVELEWTTGTEIDIAGFNVCRSEVAHEGYVRINADLIPAKGSEDVGADYIYIDPDIEKGWKYYYKLESIDLVSNSTWYGPILITLSMTSIAEEPSAYIPDAFHLAQNYPNPFNVTTDIRYQIPDVRFPVHTTLKIFNILGQEIVTLVDEIRNAGYHTVHWNGADKTGQEVPSGVYLYRITAGHWFDTKKMVLLK